MLNRATPWDTMPAIGSQALAGGLMPHASPASLTILDGGPHLAHANLTARQAKAAGLLMSGTYGLRSTGKFCTPDRQLSLANKLHRLRPLNGLTLWRLIWKTKITGGVIDLCAAGVGAPHIRQRLFWYARLADCDENRCQSRMGEPWKLGVTGSGLASRMGNGDQPGLQGWELSQSSGNTENWRPVRPPSLGIWGNSPTSKNNSGPWDHVDWLRGADGFWRPVEPGSLPVDDGISGRVGAIEGYGNAIVPQVAAWFLTAIMEGGN